MNTLNQLNISELKLGILGGGQLGKMLVKAASQWSINTFVLDPSSDCPASFVCNTFVKGDFNNYNDVYAFGKLVDIITIEIENVNTEALIQLVNEGKIVYPEPQQLEIIKDKGLQKGFYEEHGLSSSLYTLYPDKKNIIKAVEDGTLKLPFIQKLRKAGYDGRGVSIIKSNEDLIRLLDGESVVEELIDIQKEISVIAARNVKGEIAIYPPVEMIFNPSANLVEYLISPAQIDVHIAKEACDLAITVINAYEITGILAVEMFLDKNNRIYINEVAPRPHNSGHQTIENSYTSQYEQHLRAILDLPLGSTQLLSPCVMVNLLGEPDYTGNPIYLGLHECMKIEGGNIHLYGKRETRAYRKMGHATVLDNDIESAKKKARIIQKTLKIIA